MHRNSSGQITGLCSFAKNFSNYISLHDTTTNNDGYDFSGLATGTEWIPAHLQQYK
jgi:hypothetical protein